MSGRRQAFQRRQFLFGLAGSAAGASAQSNWQLFKDHFLWPDGRIVDHDNDGTSHSEGQAWGMLLAAIEGDSITFNRIRSWTLTHLAIRGDALLAWRFRTRPSRGVDDINAAIDADLCHAWALLRAEQQWPGQGYRRDAQRIAADILRLSVRDIQGRALLLPAPDGFLTAQEIILNPSYYVFPAIEAIQAAFPSPAWRAVLAQGEALLEQSRFGRWGLPADWVVLRRPDGTPLPQPGRGERFGYDAVRVPLYLAWSGRWNAAPLVAARCFWDATSDPSPPAWVRLTDGAMAPYAGGPGLRAIHRLIGGPDTPAVSMAAHRLGGSYYQAALALLSEVAQREAPMRLAPACRNASPTAQHAERSRW